MTEELLSFCECGCGQRVSKEGNKFVRGHNRRDIKHSPKAIRLMSEAAIERCGDSKYQDKRLMTLKQYYISNPEAREAARLKAIEYWSDKDNRDKASEIKKQFYINNSEAGAENSARQIQYWIDHPEYRKAMSEIRLNSKLAQRLYEMMRGGNDIINHHHIYDDNDLSKYTIEMTRSDHGLLHRNMYLLGLEIPHINTGHENEDELKLIEYIKKVEFEPKGL